jgi:predicted protein tyrosine phosphatase
MSKPSKMQLRLAAGKAGRNAVPRQHGFVSARVMDKHETARQRQQLIADEEARHAEKRVIFMSRDTAARYPFTADDVLVSISDTFVKPPEFTTPPQDSVAVDFHDYIPYAGSNEGHHWITFEQGIDIANFVLKHTDKRNIIVHCNYGESRSKAVAMAIKACMPERAVMRSNNYGNLVAYTEKDDVGNHRVHSIMLDAILFRSEGEDA